MALPDNEYLRRMAEALVGAGITVNSTENMAEVGGNPVATGSGAPSDGSQRVTPTINQYSGAPSNFTVGTTDATVFTLAAGEIGFIQNLDDAALAVKKGASASTSSFSLILGAGSAADDGKGGSVQIDDWIGVVSVAAMAGSPRYIAWKQAP